VHVDAAPGSHDDRLDVSNALAVVLLGAAALAWIWARRQTLRADRTRHALEEEVAALEHVVTSRETMLATMQEGIVLFDADGQVRYANPAAGELLGRRFRRGREVPARLKAAVAGVRNGQGRSESLYETSGRAVEVVVTETDPAGSALLVARDVTAARETEQLRRDFVANASHELKTPVASIQGLASALDLAGDDREATRRFVSMLGGEADRLGHLVSDLLDLSRLESDAGPLEPVRLDHVVTEESDKLLGQAHEAGLRLVVERPRPILVMGRESDLGQMVHNLLGNAIRYTHPGGEVRLSLKHEEAWAVVRVQDTGIGVPPADLDRVFERFYRVDAARDRETGGTGLGLAIVRHVAESHGGEVGVSSTLGLGSTFTARIPVLDGS
jgi:signal transduction histidine kinase